MPNRLAGDRVKTTCYLEGCNHRLKFFLQTIFNLQKKLSEFKNKRLGFIHAL